MNVLVGCSISESLIRQQKLQVAPAFTKPNISVCRLSKLAEILISVLMVNDLIFNANESTFERERPA